MTADVHALAVVAPAARLGAGVKIGPFCIVGPQVVLGDGVELVSHVAIAGRTVIGARTVVYPFAALGHPPQDLKYRGEPSTLIVGEACVVREGVTIHPGTAGGGLETRVGARCLLMANAHVGHDCAVGDEVVLSNNVMLGGHVRIGVGAVLGGGVAVIQHARIGAYAFVGGMSGLEADLIPYGLACGNRACLAGLNLVGLRRRDFPRETIAALRRAYRLLFAAEGTMEERIDDVQAELGGVEHVAAMLTFLREAGDRPICRPRDGA